MRSCSSWVLEGAVFPAYEGRIWTEKSVDLVEFAWTMSLNCFGQEVFIWL